MSSHYGRQQLVHLADKVSSYNDVILNVGFSDFSDMLNQGLKSSDRSIRDFAWELVVKKYSPRLRRYIAASLRTCDLAVTFTDDIEQDTWITGLEKIRRFDSDDEEKFYRWLRAIAHNHIRNLSKGVIRHYKYHQKEDAAGGDLDELDRSPSKQETNEDAIALKQQIAALVDVLNTLSDRDQELITRNILNAEQPRELAVEYGIESQSVTKALQRAKIRIREKLESTKEE